MDVKMQDESLSWRLNVKSYLNQGLAQFGHAMRRHARLIQAVQWCILFVYLLLLIIPVMLDVPPEQASILTHLSLFAQFVFWGLWWPFVMLSVMAMGRLWCGVFCPEGMLTELASKHGKARAIPKFLRWGGWPTLAFISTTVYGQLISVYDYPKAALLILGGSTLVAVLVGYLYGREKRVWCRYLCPASGVFALLARLSPLHFAANEQAWRSYRGANERINCAPLLDLRHMSASSQCHMCGRCSGHRQAIRLQLRVPGQEVLHRAGPKTSRWDAALLLFGVMGLAMGAFQWTASPWFVWLKTKLAEHLIAGEHFALFDDQIPWWILTHSPATGDVFSYLDGVCILLYLGLASGLIGGLSVALQKLATRCLQTPQGELPLPWQDLCMALIPMGGIGLFLGLSMMSLSHLRAEGVIFSWVAQARAGMLLIAVLWSCTLAWKLIRTRAASVALGRQMLAMSLFSLNLGLVLSCWLVQFFVW